MSAFDPKRTLAMPETVEHCSLTTPREKLVKIAAKAVRVRAEAQAAGAP